MSIAGLSMTGRIATRLAAAFAPPYMARFYLARITAKPYVDPDAIIHHGKLELGSHVFIADRVIVYQASDGGRVIIGDSTHILRDSVLETGQGGSIKIGIDSFLHPRCQVMAYKGDITIGDHVCAISLKQLQIGVGKFDCCHGFHLIVTLTSVYFFLPNKNLIRGFQN